MKISNPLNTLAILSLAAISLQGCVDRNAQVAAAETAKIVSNPVKEVTVDSVKVETITEALSINGEIVTQKDTQVSVASGGKITNIWVREGDTVQAGQVIATLDTDNLQQQVQLAKSNLASTRAQLAQAKNSLRLTPSRSDASIRQAEASLRFAKANLEKANNGARNEDREQAQNNLRSAKSNLDTAKKQLDRVRTLVNEGALAESQLDSAKNAYEAALAQYDNSLVAVSLTKNATRPEDILAAKESVRQAEQALESAKANKRLDVNLTQQVEAVQAQVRSAEAQVRVAEKNLAEAVVRAPFTGKVYGKPLQEGAVVSPGTPVVRLIADSGIYFEGQVPSDQLGKIRPGTPVTIKVDSLPNRSFSGKISAISPIGEAVGRMFNIRVQFNELSEMVRPGMFASGSVVTQSLPNSTLIPSIAITSRNGENWVMVASGDKSRKVVVTPGFRKGDLIQVTGIPTDAKVIVKGQSALVDGSSIRVVSQPAK